MFHHVVLFAGLSTARNKGALELCSLRLGGLQPGTSSELPSTSSANNRVPGSLRRFAVT